MEILMPVTYAYGTKPKPKKVKPKKIKAKKPKK
jgi:hypothetical protein